jgi:hypothetical protein
MVERARNDGRKLDRASRLKKAANILENSKNHDRL